ncbi:hypothetical protein J5226_24465 [Lysobacter sp. K5869]|uniref:hypothetical protein n=1 Tax=Lysobacter sp. K5869 TaxID=2820808 RepID=UPI001C0603C5|nr:hypothetical protein [Lysobacter sp. K5869]QWP76692.1 hypothetical protein J5226_24465 [Lysobacter sp. K5869]
MGILRPRAYPTKLFFNAADHTYVECGSGGMAWGCWGGKTGGRALREANGSTKRADAIAGPKERAGITCYLINGVCHQAANRVLFPARITVVGARGYSLSSAIFGVYGRPRGPLGTCSAPFDQHPGVSGDLSACLHGVRAGYEEPTDDDAGEAHGPPDFEDAAYMAEVNALYQDRYLRALGDDADAYGFQMQHFALLVQHKERTTPLSLQRGEREALMIARSDFEKNRIDAEQALAATRDPLAFADAFDALTLKFQDDAAEALSAEHYRDLLDLSPEERIVLADPDIVASAYGLNPSGPAAT